MELDVDTICRICLRPANENSVSLFDSKTKEQNSIVSKIMASANVLICAGDGLPNLVCLSCRQSVEAAYRLRLKCEESDKIIRSHLLGTLEIKDEDEFQTCNDDISFEEEIVILVQPKEETIQQKDDGKLLKKNVCCGSCQTSFKSSYELKRHRKMHKKSVDVVHMCRICEKHFADDQTLTKHMVDEHTSEVKLDEQDKPSRKSVACKVCKRMFLQPNNLSAHMRTHTGVKPSQCQVCKRSFTNGRALASHMRTHASEVEMPHECDMCEKRFLTLSQLEAHEVNQHSGRTYCCETCGKIFSNLCNLKAHIRLHTGIKPYSCNICNRKFAQTNSYSYHMRTHSGEQPFACDVCPRTFYISSQLTNHKRLHTGEKPYICSICAMSFTQKSACTAHMKTHTGEKSFLCSICGKSYTQEKHLTEHTMKLHPVHSAPKERHFLQWMPASLQVLRETRS